MKRLKWDVLSRIFVILWSTEHYVAIWKIILPEIGTFNKCTSKCKTAYMTLTQPILEFVQSPRFSFLRKTTDELALLSLQ